MNSHSWNRGYQQLSDELLFTPYAWAKLCWMRDHADKEVGGMAVSDPDNPLLIWDILIPKQEVSTIRVEFSGEGLALLLEEATDRKIEPWQCMRIWCHTHPQGMGPQPSATDERTFKETMGAHDWAIMFILAKDGETYCRLRLGSGAMQIEGTLVVDVTYDYSFPGTDFEGWEKEYEERVEVRSSGAYEWLSTQEGRGYFRRVSPAAAASATVESPAAGPQPQHCDSGASAIKAVPYGDGIWERALWEDGSGYDRKIKAPATRDVGFRNEYPSTGFIAPPPETALALPPDPDPPDVVDWEKVEDELSAMYVKQDAIARQLTDESLGCLEAATLKEELDKLLHEIVAMEDLIGDTLLLGEDALEHARQIDEAEAPWADGYTAD